LSPDVLADTPEAPPGRGGYRLLLGNEAMAQGLFEAGCKVAAAYPGTPSTEILEALAAYETGDLHLEWSVNEKIALEVASAASFAGLRSAAVMKQVGLNVALDPLMSLAYTGVAGGMVIIVADDPGPHSSQTEQDTRLMAMAAGVPVLDPVTPEQAREMVHKAYEISESYQVPVIVRPVLRICHSRGPVPPVSSRYKGAGPVFIRDTNRWAATPRHRFTLHGELNRKLEKMRSDSLVTGMNSMWRQTRGEAGFAILASGTPAAYAMDLVTQKGMAQDVPLFVVQCPWPFDEENIVEFLGRYKKVLVLEETGPLMERLLRYRLNVSGRFDGLIPSEGEITPDTVADALDVMLGEIDRDESAAEIPARQNGDKTAPSAIPPTLCAGCPHRSSFWALKKAMPGAIYTGDIGCYTLGIELGAVDTVLCMGASISQAAGFYWAYRQSPETTQPVAAVIGDSTFYHTGVPALINTVQQGAAFVLMIVDNGTTAMTGCQPTPGTGILLSGKKGKEIPLEDVVRGCGVKKLWVADPLKLDNLVDSIAMAASAAAGGEMAVVISRSPCVLNITERQGTVPTVDPELCGSCGVCTERFGCPAIMMDKDGCHIITERCPGCGICVEVCPMGAIIVGHGGGER
jgi:indolepyruvate ferredoxin oxidoreductase alpha subunit